MAKPVTKRLAYTTVLFLGTRPIELLLGSSGCSETYGSVVNHPFWQVGQSSRLVVVGGERC